MSRIALPAAVLLFLSGCIFPFCVYPRLDYTPRTAINAPSDEVHAFRVDAQDNVLNLLYSGQYPIVEHLTRLPVTNTDEVPAQLQPSVTRGFVIIGIALNYVTYRSQWITLRLYRPGYELVVVRSWQRDNRVTWKRADDIEVQETAVDRLLPDNAVGEEAERLAASEYERLAALATSPDQAKRLGEKAAKLRARAKQ